MLVKAFLARKDDPSQAVTFLFNPAEFTVEKSNEFSEVNIPGLPSSILQFVKGGARTLTMDLFFDTYEQGTDVRQYTDRITGWDAGAMFSKLQGGKKGLMDLDSDLHAPPVCLFVWGTFVFQCIIERVSKRFTMFLPEGVPVRATLNVSLKEYRDYETQVKEVGYQSADRTKRWTVKQGESLWLIATKAYGDPALWRPIAEANGIENPRVLSAGRELTIPPLE
ncbi:MAG: LysM peptidoglycan-binding domain-containing protein [Bacillota bacterium]